MMKTKNLDIRKNATARASALVSGLRNEVNLRLKNESTVCVNRRNVVFIVTAAKSEQGRPRTVLPRNWRLC